MLRYIEFLALNSQLNPAVILLYVAGLIYVYFILGWRFVRLDVKESGTCARAHFGQS